MCSICEFIIVTGCKQARMAICEGVSEQRISTVWPGSGDSLTNVLPEGSVRYSCGPSMGSQTARNVQVPNGLQVDKSTSTPNIKKKSGSTQMT